MEEMCERDGMTYASAFTTSKRKCDPGVHARVICPQFTRDFRIFLETPTCHTTWPHIPAEVDYSITFKAISPRYLGGQQVA
jgi:hypothetical protein